MPEANNNRRTLIFIMILVVIVLIVALVWWFFLREDVEIPLANTNNTNANTNITANANTPLNQNTNAEAPVDEEVEDRLSMTRTAQIFTERFGSYTNETAFENTRSLIQYMTEDMKAWADSYIAENTGGVAGEYYAVVSKVVTTEVISQDESAATLELTAQRTFENDEFVQTDQYYQTISIEMVQSDGTWLVDSATWQDRVEL